MRYLSKDYFLKQKNVTPLLMYACRAALSWKWDLDANVGEIEVLAWKW